MRNPSKYEARKESTLRIFTSVVNLHSATTGTEHTISKRPLCEQMILQFFFNSITENRLRNIMKHLYSNVHISHIYIFEPIFIESFIISFSLSSIDFVIQRDVSNISIA